MIHSRAAEHPAGWAHRAYRDHRGSLAAYWPQAGAGTPAFSASIQDLPRDLLAQLGDEFNVVIVQGVATRTPGANAGVRVNDVLLAVEDVRIGNSMELAT